MPQMQMERWLKGSQIERLAGFSWIYQKQKVTISYIVNPRMHTPCWSHFRLWYSTVAMLPGWIVDMEIQSGARETLEASKIYLQLVTSISFHALLQAQTVAYQAFQIHFSARMFYWQPASTIKLYKSKIGKTYLWRLCSGPSKSSH